MRLVLYTLRLCWYNQAMPKDTMKLSNELETRIGEALRPLPQDRVILFGNRVWGQPTDDSRQSGWNALSL